jgi:hypothetical protein
MPSGGTPWRTIAVVVATATAAVLVPSLATGQQPGRQVTLVAEPALIRFNTANVSVHGQLVGVSNPGRVRVTLRSAVSPYRRFRPRARMNARPDGTFAFTVAPSVNTQYEVVALARPSPQSPAVGVLVLRQVTIKLSSATPRAGRRLRVSGFVYPKEDGDAIALQFGDGTNWRTVQTARIYDVGSGRSGYGFVRAAPRRRTQVRVVLPADGQHPDSASGARSLRPR